MSNEKKEPKKPTLSLPKQAPDAKVPVRTKSQVRPPQPGIARKPRPAADAATKTATAEDRVPAKPRSAPSGQRPPQGERKPKPYEGRSSSPDTARPTRSPRPVTGNEVPNKTRDETRTPPAKPSFERHPSRSHKEGEAYVRPPRPTPAPNPDGTMRLSKRMAELGLCSRREADEYIERGWVRVDGVVISELGSRVLPEQQIDLAKQATTVQDMRVTILLNKPIGYVSGQAEDGYTPASVLITEETQWDQDPTGRALERSHFRGLAPAGRLDIDSTGLLVLTQDGRIAKSLVGDKSPIEKEYLVRVEGSLTEEGMQLLNHGLTLDGIKLKPSKVSWANEDQLRFVLREGRKRQIRRMCELVGLNVVGLRRVRIGRIPLGHLPVGQWRFLGEFEKF